MTQHIFIGVDGGASKCRVRIEDEQGNLIGIAVGGPANIRFSAKKAWNTIHKAIDEVLIPNDISLRDDALQFHTGIGLAGCEVKEDREDFLQQPHTFKSLRLTSDAHVACLGAHHAKDGAIIIVGTGVVGYQIHDGTTSQVGGWGFPHDDEGGGAWLGLEAVRLTFQSVDHRVEKTPLLEDVFAFFKGDINYMTTWSVRATSTDFGRIAPLVINHSQQKDPNALHLMKKAGQFISKIGNAMEKKHSGDPLPCSLFGGVAPFVEPYLEDALRSRLVPHKQDPSCGAILMMKKLLESA